MRRSSAPVRDIPARATSLRHDAVEPGIVGRALRRHTKLGPRNDSHVGGQRGRACSFQSRSGKERIGACTIDPNDCLWTLLCAAELLQFALDPTHDTLLSTPRSIAVLHLL